MYKIYINGNCLGISTPSFLQNIDKERMMVVPYFGSKKGLLQYVDKLEKTEVQQDITLVAEDDKSLFKSLKSLYRVIKAAGGIIVNPSGELLFIYRLDRWDLPKGKCEDLEKSRETAVREVEEETGLTCDITGKEGVTYHTYMDRRGRRVLKKTNWYAMRSLKNQKVKVQVEEEITDHKWMTPESFLQGDFPTYRTIQDLVTKWVESHS